jgi:Lrp/AsnC family leucine-responsive transcriptional regulator
VPPLGFIHAQVAGILLLDPSKTRNYKQMTFDLDSTDWAILRALQKNGRTTIAETARMVGLTPPATAERIRRLEDQGVVRGYHASIDLEKIGRPICAFIRVRFAGGKYEPFEKVVERSEAILECHHITGEDCFIVKAAVGTMSELEELATALGRFGPTATSVVYSTVFDRRVIDASPADDNAKRVALNRRGRR